MDAEPDLELHLQHLVSFRFFFPFSNKSLLIFPRVQHLGHVRTIQEVSETSIVTTHANTGDNTDLLTAVLLPRNALRLLHQQGPKAMVLELARITSMEGHSGAVDVQLADDTRRLAGELWTEGVLVTALAQTKQAQ